MHFFNENILDFLHRTLKEKGGGRTVDVGEHVRIVRFLEEDKSVQKTDGRLLRWANMTQTFVCFAQTHT